MSKILISIKQYNLIIKKKKILIFLNYNSNLKYKNLLYFIYGYIYIYISYYILIYDYFLYTSNLL